MHRHLRAARRLAAATAVATLALVPAVVSAPHTRAAAAVLTGPAARDGTTSRATRIAQLAEERKALQPAVIAQNRQRRSTERAGGAGPRVATGTVTPKVGSLNSLHTWPSVGIATVPLAADIAGVVPTNDRGGYWLLGFDGSMVPFGDAPYFGDALSAGTVDVWVGAAEDAAGDGYWEVDAAGCVLAFGGASSTLEDACGRVNGVATAITATHSSQGYWILDSSGFVHFFGNATTSGGANNTNGSAFAWVGMAAIPGDNGYWLLADDGGVEPFGAAPYFGSLGGHRILGSASAIESTTTGDGYWIATTGGEVANFPTQNGRNFGDISSVPGRFPLVGVAGTADNGGYWLATEDGSVTSKGDATQLGGDNGVELATMGVSGTTPMPSDFTATLDWGDGTIEPGRIHGTGGMVVTGSHTYPRPDFYALTITVRDTLGHQLQVQTAVIVQPDGGYWMAASDGGIFAFGTVRFYGSMGAVKLNSPVVGIARSPFSLGYYMVAADGGLFAFGPESSFHGSMGGQHLNSPIVGMAVAPDGQGYWLVGADGGIFAFGTAGFHGSMGGQHLNSPVVGMAAAPDGQGYWLVAADGGIFAFGSAEFFGSAGNINLAKPVVGMAARRDGLGYWLVASDGGVFAYNTGFYGSMGGKALAKPIVGIDHGAFPQGYWEVASDGGIFAFNAPFYGSTGGMRLNQPVVGIAGE